MRFLRCLCSGVWTVYRAPRVVRVRVSGKGVVPVLVSMALAVLLMACAPTAGGGGVTARATATRSAAVGTPTTTERLAMVARAAFGGGVQQSEATYDGQSQTVKVTGTLGGDVPVTDGEIAAAHERTKALCFQVQRALWTSGITLHEVTVLVRGPTFDDYGNQYLDGYGTAVVEEATAKTLAWATLSADGAWERYDRVWLRPNYRPNWHYGAPPTATPSPTAGRGG
jgi:hypothetical protein